MSVASARHVWRGTYVCVSCTTILPRRSVQPSSKVVSHTPPFEFCPPFEDGLGVPKKIVHGDRVKDAALRAHELLSLLVHGEDEGDGVLDRKRGLERELRDAGRINVHVHLAE